MKGMTAQDAPDGVIPAPKRAVALDGLDGIARAGGVKTTTRPE